MLLESNFERDRAELQNRQFLVDIQLGNQKGPSGRIHDQVQGQCVPDFPKNTSKIDRPQIEYDEGNI